MYKNNKKKLNTLLSSFFLICYLLYILTADLNYMEEGYTLTFLLPIVYIICWKFFLSTPFLEVKSPFIVLFTIISFFRYVVLSILTIINGGYDGISGIALSGDTLNLASILMAWELLVSSLLIYFLFNKKLKKISNSKKNSYIEMHSKANISVYIVVSIISFFLIVIIPDARLGISFFSNISYSMRNEIGSVLILGIRELFINAKYFVLFAIIIVLQRKYSNNFSKNRIVSYVIILLVVSLMIGIRVGANRKKMLSDSVASLLLLWNLFPKYRKISIVIVTTIGILLVSMTTSYRGMTTTTGAFFSEYINLDVMQSYFLGQYNVGIAIEAKEIYSHNITISNFFLSLMRPIFGIGSLVKNIDFIHLDSLFDSRMSMGIVGFRGDQILPIIGEGFMYFGIVLSPIFLMIVTKIGIFFDELYLKSHNIEVTFISSLISFYLAQGMILNFTIVLNMLSFRLAIYLPVVFLAILKKRTKYYPYSLNIKS